MHFCTESVHELVAAECWNLHFDAGMWFARATVRRTTWAEVVQELSRADPDTWQDFDGCDAWLASVRDDHRRVRMRFDAAARLLQRAWRAHRAYRRKRAALVIEDAVLDAMYRPGGWRHPAILRRLAECNTWLSPRPNTHSSGRTRLAIFDGPFV